MPRESLAENEERSDILLGIADRDTFHKRRDLAIQRPDRARDKLTGYAVLKLKIIKARNLPAGDVTGFSDPYVKVDIDDAFKAETQQIRVELNPVWNWETQIQIKSPASVVLLRVMDYDLGVEDDLLGFVEFPVADLPLGSNVQGWFQLTPAEKLTGTAPERLAASLKRMPEEKCGAVFLDMILDVVSGDKSDEHYAWCLPTPEFYTYPAAGYDPKRMNPQSLIDNIMEIKSGIMLQLMNPLFGCIAYVLSWQEPLLSLLMLLTALGTSLRPDLYATGVLGMLGLFLLFLRSPARRLAIIAHPSTVPLNDEGLELVARTQSTDKTLIFVKRVVAALRGQILDQDKLREFAAFASFEGKTVCDYSSLKRQLQASAEAKEPFLKMQGSPLPPGCLIRWAEKRGEVVRCVNPKDQMMWRYLVRLDSCTEPKEVQGDELETRLDLRWMTSPPVLVLIPDSVEDMIAGFQPTFENLNRTVSSAWQPIAKIASWQDPRKTFSLSMACLLLSVAFIWVQRPVFVLVSIYMFSKSISIFMQFSMHRFASKQERRYAAKDFMSWGFFRATGATGATTQDEGAPEGLFSAFAACTIRKACFQ